MTTRDPVHDLIAQVIIRLGCERVPPEYIRSALALNLVNLCAASSAHGAKAALNDVRMAIEVKAKTKLERKANAN